MGKIQSAREKRILGEVEPAKNEAVSNARRSEEYGDRIEMYEELEVEKHVYGIIKNGENRVLADDEGLTLFDQEIIEYSKVLNNSFRRPRRCTVRLAKLVAFLRFVMVFVFFMLFKFIV